ncbi:sugar phosphate isomerase/epimerase family protein [Sphaerisporangium corydalis]|uniref:Sugar phosphate isomerase/epimerase family protein n=1 Tax=Sphaerisporangium corydalis TaxID=1441875 RepID=A0ABV9EN14_9ACTN|nr:sugar phosphate isomerase/epimerase family protein [Sphaerisporangium corydalis]
MRLAVQERLLPGRTLQERFGFAVEAGFDAVELRGEGDLRFAGRRAELRRALADGVVMPVVAADLPHLVGDPDPGGREEAVRQLCSQLEVIGELGGLGVTTPVSRSRPPRPPGHDREALARALGTLGEHAARHGVLIMLEPLNRYEDHLVNTLAQAVDLCSMDSVRVAGNTFHMNIEEDDPCRSLAEAAPCLAHMRIGESNHHQPGTGHLDWAAQLGTLSAIGYEGHLALDCDLRGDPEAVLPRTSAFVRKFL